MSQKKALLINYQFCTGCHSCEVACKAEHDLPTGQWGIKILQDGPRQKPDGTWEYNYLPMPTSLCDMCAKRVGEGRLPKCVHHCQAGCMYYGDVEEMAKIAAEMPNSAMFVVEGASEADSIERQKAAGAVRA